MKKTLYNGKIYLSRGQFAQAICFEDETILMVGDDASVLAFAGDCQREDLMGRTVIPGLNDSHTHLISLGQRMAQASIAGAVTIDELVARCRQFTVQNPLLAQSGIRATGWNEDLYVADGRRCPDRWDLDRISADVPVVLHHGLAHKVAVNTRALEMAGLAEGAPQVPGGTVVLGEDGRPSGLLLEAACRLVDGVIPPLSQAQTEALTLKAMDYCVAHGLTSVQSNDVGQSPMGAGETFDMLRRLYGQGLGKVRYYHQMYFTEPELHAFLGPEGERSRGAYPQPNWLRLGCLKLFRDGALGSRTATTRQPYLDDPGNCGTDAMPPELIERMVALADAHGLQVAIHAIGDKAIADTLDTYERVLKGGPNPLRHSIIHYQCVDPALMARTARMGIPAQCQPIFLTTDLHAVASRFPPELNRWFLGFRSFLQHGIPLSFGSDCPAEDCNPFLGIYCAVNRKDVLGAPEAGFYPQECIDVEAAIDCFTVGSSYNEFAEQVKGRLRAGYLADMVVLDTDIFTCPPMEIKNIRPVETIVGGQTMYRA